MSETKFSPGPWKITGNPLNPSIYADSSWVSIAHTSEINVFSPGNAERIVKCVNLFDELVGAVGRELEELDFADAPTEAQRARRKYLFALLQRARGE